MVDAINKSNNGNNPMKLPKLEVGVVSAPQNTIKPNLYTDTEATRKLKKLNKVINEKKKNDTFEKRQTTPTGVFVVLGAIVAAVALYKLKAASAIKTATSRLKTH